MGVRNLASGYLQIGKRLKDDNDVTICRNQVIIKFFGRCFIFLVKVSYWFKCRVNIIAGSRVFWSLTVFFYKELSRNLVTVHTWVGREEGGGVEGGLGIPKFKILLNAAKCQGYSFYLFWAINGKPTGWWVKLPPTQIRVRYLHHPSVSWHINPLKF